MDNLLFILVPVMAFVLFWIVLIHAIGFLSGWGVLARHYSATGEPEGITFSMQSLSLGWTGYGNCLKIIVGNDGLYMRVWGILRPGHPPLFFPWSELRIKKVTRRRWYPTVTVTLSAVPHLPLTFLLPVLEAAQKLFPLDNVENPRESNDILPDRLN